MMSSRFALPDGAIAQYIWGSAVPRFSVLAPVETRTLPESLAGIIEDAGHWKDGPDFRRKIALQHEVVHYLQDMLTGIGYWDFLVRRNHVKSLLGVARSASWLHGERLPLNTGGVYEKHKCKMIEELIMVRSDELPVERRQALASGLKAEAGEDHDPTPYFIAHLLEGEAVATVWMQFRSLYMSADQNRIAEANSEFVNPRAMPPAYIVTIEQILTLTTHLLGYELSEVQPLPAEKVPLVFDFGYRLLILLVDIACAHPSPSLLDRSGLPKSEFEPGLKLVRLARALQYMSESDFEHFGKVWLEKDLDTAERIILSACAFPYTHSRDIYEDWLQVFKELAVDDDDRILKLRTYSCKRRLEVPYYSHFKTIASFLQHKVPLFVLNARGLQSHGFSWEYLDPEEQEFFVADLARHERDNNLVEFYLETGRFICPLAEARICSASTSICKSGIVRSSQFPPAEACLVRRGLEEARFCLMPHDHLLEGVDDEPSSTED